MANLLYLGEYVTDSYVVECLRKTGLFNRIDHLTKPTLELTHISINPQPDLILLKCDWENNELKWGQRYSPEIPKIFVICNLCISKLDKYQAFGNIYLIEDAFSKEDFTLMSLAQLVLALVD